MEGVDYSSQTLMHDGRHVACKDKNPKLVASKDKIPELIALIRLIFRKIKIFFFHLWKELSQCKLLKILLLAR